MKLHETKIGRVLELTGAVTDMPIYVLTNAITHIQRHPSHTYTIINFKSSVQLAVIETPEEILAML